MKFVSSFEPETNDFHSKWFLSHRRMLPYIRIAHSICSDDKCYFFYSRGEVEMGHWT